jgi:hypothetical protein
MTSHFRLVMAVIISASALLTGWLRATPSIDTVSAASVRDWQGIQQSNFEDVDRLVERILQSDLFPDARLLDDLEPSSSQSTDTAEGLAAALGDPSLTALVRRGDVWRIYLYGAFEGAQVREVGDQLADGWLIVSIEPTVVTLERGAESRRIDVFDAERHSE